MSAIRHLLGLAIAAMCIACGGIAVIDPVDRGNTATGGAGGSPVATVSVGTSSVGGAGAGGGGGNGAGGGSGGSTALSGRVIVWGGFDGNTPKGDGGIYDVRTDSWSRPAGLVASPLSARASHSAVWTGDAMIVWGGIYGKSDGAIYHPDTDTWSTPPGLSASPIGAREDHMAVWTGTHMLVWGGFDRPNSQDENDGAMYDPSSDTWTVPAQLGGGGPLAVRRSSVVVWTGSQMLIWSGGGYISNTFVQHVDGAGYDPSDDTWSVPAGLQTSPPGPRSTAAGVWSGDALIVWGGMDSSLEVSGTGELFSGSWQKPPGLSQSPLSARFLPEGVWVGSAMLIWGGNIHAQRLSDGAIYHPSSDSWSRPAGLSSGEVPAPRSGHTAVWAP